MARTWNEVVDFGFRACGTVNIVGGALWALYMIIHGITTSHMDELLLGSFVGFCVIVIGIIALWLSRSTAPLPSED